MHIRFTEVLIDCIYYIDLCPLNILGVFPPNHQMSSENILNPVVRIYCSLYNQPF